MARIIVAQFTTLDGVVEDPDGSDGTPFGGWAFRHGREAVAGDKFAYGPILETGVFLFGRATWEYFSRLWPGRDDPFARSLNAADKAVATNSGVDLDCWENSRLVHGDVVEWAGEESATRDVVLVGSGSLVSRFIEAGQVDEYRLRIFPTATGAGRRLFPNGSRLELVSSEQLGPSTLLICTPERRSDPAAAASASTTTGAAASTGAAAAG